MKLIGLMVVRNESWILGESLRHALRWCDEVVVIDHASHDGTTEIISKLSAENPWRIHYSRWQPTEKKMLTSRYPNAKGEFESWEADVPTENESFWPEMEVRQHGLLLTRKHSATHVGMIDADEFLTANLIDRVRQDAAKLQPTEVLEYPLFAMRSLSEYQDDGSVWCGGQLSLIFADAPHLAWKNASDGYWFHSRVPFGTGKRIQPLQWAHKQGGVLHLQFANQRRLIAKHCHYAITEMIQWPGRMTPEQINAKYGQALEAPKHCSQINPEWWNGCDLSQVVLEDWCWYEGEIRKVIEKYGRERFAGLDLRGY